MAYDCLIADGKMDAKAVHDFYNFLLKTGQYTSDDTVRLTAIWIQTRFGRVEGSAS